MTGSSEQRPVTNGTCKQQNHNWSVSRLESPDDCAEVGGKPDGDIPFRLSLRGKQLRTRNMHSWKQFRTAAGNGRLAAALHITFPTNLLISLIR